MLDLPDAKVRCVYVEGAGCYGRNGHEDAAADAALLARLASPCACNGREPMSTSGTQKDRRPS
jgi:hypothetical protein